jgi:hypothetical protein
LDPEKPIRNELMKELRPFFLLWEEVDLRTKSGKNVRADILAIERKFQIPFAVAIEIKSLPPKQPKDYRDTFMQAFDYVDAKIADSRVSGFPECAVKFALIHQHRTRCLPSVNRGQLVTPELIYSLQMDGLELAFNSFRVGHTLHLKDQISFRLAHNELWSAKKSWSAELHRRAPEIQRTHVSSA